MDLTHARVMYDHHIYTVSDALRAEKLARLRARMEDQGIGAVMICGRISDGLYNMFTGISGPDEPSAASGGLIIGMQGDVLEIGDAVVAPNEDETEQERDVMHPPALRVPGIRPAKGLNPGKIAAMCAARRKIGIVHMDLLKASWRDAVRRELPACRMVDFTKEALECLAEKLPEEIAMLRDSAAGHDRVFAALPVFVRPERLERELVIQIRRALLDQGAAGQDFDRVMKVNLVSAPQTGPAEAEPLRFPGRRLREGDQVQLLVRAALVNDVYAVLGRHMVLGRATDEVRTRWNTLVRAQQAAIDVLKVGVSIADAARAANAELRAAGYPEDDSAFIYGVGYGLGEPPVLGYPGEDAPLACPACLAVAPSLRLPGQAPMCAADTVLIHQGCAERLTKTGHDLMELLWE